MIPASYLFKDIYHQHWDEPVAPVVIERKHRFLAGLLNPLTAPAIALFATRERRETHRFGGRAYE